MWWYLSLAVLACFVVRPGESQKRYEPTWESLDTRPIPTWYDEAKFGIFIHWGVFSVPGFGSEWFWYDWARGSQRHVDFMKKNYPPSFTYADFAAQFTAEFYNPDQWADIFKASGAKYIVLTSKHHEGFTNWNSSVSFSWNSLDVGPKRDLVGDLAKSIRSRTDIHFGLYHSLFEWFNPLYLEDSKNKFQTRHFVERKTLPELYELVHQYKPDIIWSDGDAGPAEYWKSKEFLAWLYNDSPINATVVVNDRWGDGCGCNHGGFYTCADRYNPGHLINHKWENCMTIDRSSWGYRREATLASIMSTHDLVTTLAETVSCGGNLLMNVGPTHDGRIIPIFEERLREFGDWLKVNGEAIYASKPWVHQNDTITKQIWYTSKGTGDNTVVYCIMLFWPKDNVLTLGAPLVGPQTYLTLLGYQEGKTGLKFTTDSNGGMIIKFPDIPISKMPSTIAWVVKMENLGNANSPIRNTEVPQRNRFYDRDRVVNLLDKYQHL